MTIEAFHVARSHSLLALVFQHCSQALTSICCRMQSMDPYRWWEMFPKVWSSKDFDLLQLQFRNSRGSRLVIPLDSHTSLSPATFLFPASVCCVSLVP